MKSKTIIAFILFGLFYGCSDLDVQSQTSDIGGNDQNNDQTSENPTNTSNQTNEVNPYINTVTTPFFNTETIVLPEGDFINQQGEQVHIPSFKILKNHVTVSQYWECIKKEECSLSDLLPRGGSEQFFFRDLSELTPETDNVPLHSVTYKTAVSFCHLLGGHLTTEDEWEYAALFDGKNIRDVDFAWGNNIPKICEDASYAERTEKHNYYCDCKTKVSSGEYDYQQIHHCEKSYPASITPTGLTGMTGDLADLVADIYQKDAAQSYDRETCDILILKGGSFYSDIDHIKIHSREYYQECIPQYDGESFENYYPGNGIGFRCSFAVNQSSKPIP